MREKILNLLIVAKDLITLSRQADFLVANDVVQVVRCKDCKNRLEGTKMCAHTGAMGWDAIEVEDDDFCSYGERKDNE